jgi:recombination protein RecA
MNASALLRSQIEARIPSAFVVSKPQSREFIPTGIAAIDDLTGGVPLNAMTEICGSGVASSGKTSVLMSLLAKATMQERFCALVDGCDGFDPASGEAAGINLSRLLWVRCGKTKQKLKPLEQAFKVADFLVQSAGFGLVAVDLSDFPEKCVRNVPLSSWFRFSRVAEKLPMALVFIEQEPHATSCARLVFRVKSKPSVWAGNLFTRCSIEVEVIRSHKKKHVHSAIPSFSLKSQWA